MNIITVNGTGYKDTDPVRWEDAIAAGGFYYSRACYLGVPNPPAVVFDSDNPRHTQAMSHYHELFLEADAKSAEAVSYETEDREIFPSVAASNLQLVADRLHELANPKPGTPVDSVMVDTRELEALAEMLTAVRADL